jgi:hypothetical protein
MVEENPYILQRRGILRRAEAYQWSTSPITYHRNILNCFHVEPTRLSISGHSKFAFSRRLNVGFTESAVAAPAQQRYLWDRIAERLNQLANRISPDDRRSIEAALIEKIGKPPSRAQREALDRRRKEIL